MVVLSPVVDIHIHCGVVGGAIMARVRVRLLPQGAGAGAQRPQAEGAKGGAPEQTGVRGDVHDRSERLGRRTYIRSDHHRTNTGKYLYLPELGLLKMSRPKYLLPKKWFQDS